MKIPHSRTLLALIASSHFLLPAQGCAPAKREDIEAAKRAANARPDPLPVPEPHNAAHKRVFGRQVQGEAAAGAAATTTTGSTSTGSSTVSGSGSTSTSSSAAAGSTPASNAAPTSSSTSFSSPLPPGVTGTTPVNGTAGVNGTTTPTPTFTVPSDPFATIPLSQIVSGAPTELTPTLRSTPTPGAQAPVSGAPVLPSLTINPSTYPPVNTVPPTDSPQVTAWMKEIAGIDPAILNITPTKDGSCLGDPAAAADTSRCWWTCGGCTNPKEDIVTCPDKKTWGLSFDDGPSPYTPKVLAFLQDHNLTGTFFVVGSRIVERPQILQAEYMQGHHISVHTWSHSVPLTALTNEQIVAELGWSREAIREVIGVSPLTWRPPWGDIDNRVRAISMAMGMEPIIWTRDPTTLAQFDTNDWRIPAGQVTGEQAFTQFQSILTNASNLDTGFIVLEHDLFQQECDLSTGYSIPAALQAQFNLMDINKCQKHANTEAYLETIVNKSAIPTFAGASGGIDVQGDGSPETKGSAQGSGGLRQRGEIGASLGGVVLGALGLAVLL